MAHVDETSILKRAHLALEASAIGQAMLDSDYEEARFRAHVLCSDAAELGLDDVARAALDVLGFLPADHSSPKPGVGRAMLRLCLAVESDG
ncbi:hypothetical protein KPL74_09000 [Bacillus sp. NP157]|nr:hypothetical protein KPL74_09000 [Bacillus sp. NP157]